MDLNLTFTINDGTLRITVACRRLDAAIAGEFKERVEAAFAAGVERVELNMATVEFMDSSGVGALLSVFRKLPTRKGLIRITHIRPGVWAVLELLHLGPLFESASGASSADRVPVIQRLNA